MTVRNAGIKGVLRYTAAEMLTNMVTGDRGIFSTRE